MDSPAPAPHDEPGGDPRELGGNPDVLPGELAHQLRSSLLGHFDARARDLPWRRTDDPYAIWVSEVMLQQTRVETVVPYWERWMRRFPDVASLAAAELDEVLKLWEGLGYYRRARMLHRAARELCDRKEPVPDTAEALRELPGIGPYTAGAVASIAFGRREPAVDGNVRRVLARLFDLPDPSPSRLRGLAAALVPDRRPGDFNQALMELGATVCTPRDPGCSECPVARRCRARAAGMQEERPAPRRRPDVPRAEYGVAVPVRDGPVRGAWEVALVRRPEEGMLGGLWEFPAGEIGSGEGGVAAARRAAGFHGIEVAEPDRRLPAVDHAYSHLKARYRPYLFRVRDRAPGVGERAGGAEEPLEEPPEGPRWMDSQGLAEAALPRAQRTIVRAVLDVLGDPP